jgi:hypothetical protein
VVLWSCGSGNNEKEEPFKGSFLRKAGRIKSKRLDPNIHVGVERCTSGIELESRVCLIQDLVSIAMIQVSEIFQEEVAALEVPIDGQKRPLAS